MIGLNMLFPLLVLLISPSSTSAFIQLIENYGNLVFNFAVTLSSPGMECIYINEAKIHRKSHPTSLSISFQTYSSHWPSDLEIYLNSPSQFAGGNRHGHDVGDYRIGYWPSQWSVDGNHPGCNEYWMRNVKISPGFTQVCIANTCGWVGGRSCTDTETWAGQFSLNNFDTSTEVSGEASSPNCMIPSDYLFTFPTLKPTNQPTARPTLPWMLHVFENPMDASYALYATRLEHSRRSALPRADQLLSKSQTMIILQDLALCCDSNLRINLLMNFIFVNGKSSVDSSVLLVKRIVDSSLNDLSAPQQQPFSNSLNISLDNFFIQEDSFPSNSRVSLTEDDLVLAAVTIDNPSTISVIVPGRKGNIYCLYSFIFGDASLFSESDQIENMQISFSLSSLPYSDSIGTNSNGNENNSQSSLSSESLILVILLPILAILIGVVLYLSYFKLNPSPTINHSPVNMREVETLSVTIVDAEAQFGVDVIYLGPDAIANPRPPPPVIPPSRPPAEPARSCGCFRFPSVICLQFSPKEKDHRKTNCSVCSSGL